MDNAAQWTYSKRAPRSADARKVAQKTNAAMSAFRRGLKATAVLGILGVGTVLGIRRVRGPEVVVLRPTRGTVVQTVVASGRVLSRGEVSLGSTLGGIVRAVHVREGERVRAAQPLVDFDDAELEAQVAQAQAGVRVAEARVGQLRGVGARVTAEQVRQAESHLRAAESTWARQSALHRTGSIPAAEFEAARRELEVARSQVEAARATAAGSRAGGGEARVAAATQAQAEAALRVAEARAGLARVSSPVDGVILRRSVEPGDVVSPGRALLVLLRDGPVELSITPDERNLADLRVGQPALASAEAFPDRPFASQVVFLAPAVDPLRGTVEVRLAVPTPPDFLRPAMTVSVEVEVGRHDAVLTLPPDAIRDAATQAPWVLMVGADGRTARRPVTLGLRGARVVEVRAGIGTDAQVLSPNTAASVGIGQRVRPTTARP